MRYFFLLILSTSLLAAETHPRNQWLNADAVIKDIELAQRAYAHIHPGYDRYSSAQELDAAWQSIQSIATTNSGMRLADLYLQISEVLAMIRCDHTKAELPKSLADARNTDPVYLPFQWQFIEDEVLVEYATEASGLNRGDTILMINDRPIVELVNSVLKYVPLDGYTDHTKMNLVATSLEHKGGALDHFGALLWQPQTLVKISYRNKQGQTVEKIMDRINYKEWLALTPAQIRNFADAVEFDWLNDTTAYLKIDTFVNYRNPVKPDKIFTPIFKQLSSGQSLVLDLRNNGGGSNEPPHRLLAHLMPEKFRPAKDVRIKTLDLSDFKDHIFTWEKQALNPKASRFNQNEDGSYSFKPNVLDDTQWIKPDKYQFNGRLIVLTSANNSSGSTNLLTVLKNRPNTTFIGEETGGSKEGPTAGVLFFLKLPNSGITARVPAFRYYNDVTDFNPGKGIIPDILVRRNKQDFIMSQDSILNAAMKL